MSVLYTFDNVIVHCTEKVLCCTLKRRFWVKERMGQQKVVGVTHRVLCTCMAAVRLGCKSNMVGTGRANSRPGCVSRLKKCHSHPLHCKNV